MGGVWGYAGLPQEGTCIHKKRPCDITVLITARFKLGATTCMLVQRDSWKRANCIGFAGTPKFARGSRSAEKQTSIRKCANKKRYQSQTLLTLRTPVVTVVT